MKRRGKKGKTAIGDEVKRLEQCGKGELSTKTIQSK
jgi:hypothetical protein